MLHWGYAAVGGRQAEGRVAAGQLPVCINALFKGDSAGVPEPKVFMPETLGGYLHTCLYTYERLYVVFHVHGKKNLRKEKLLNFL